MGILNSVLVGKARKSAGNITTYSRLGTSCFRQKPTISPNYRPSIAQEQQRSVYKFLKLNINEFGLSALINALNDAKPVSGKGQTKMNMVYQSFLPHVQDVRTEIFEIINTNPINSLLFLGADDARKNNFTLGLLSSFNCTLDNSGACSFSSVTLNGLVSRANSMRSSNTPLFTASDLWLSFMYGETGKIDIINQVVMTKATLTGTPVAPVFSPTATVTLPTDQLTYVAITIGKDSGEGIVDVTKSYFSTHMVSVVVPAAP